MPKSSKNTPNLRLNRLQINLNYQETLDKELIEATEGIKIQDFIRNFIREQARTIRREQKNK